MPFISILALVITYWVDKYLILHKWSEPHYQSDAVFKQNKENMVWMLLCFTFLNTLSFFKHIFQDKNIFQNTEVEVIVILQYFFLAFYAFYIFVVNKSDSFYF